VPVFSITESELGAPDLGEAMSLQLSF
jgi:hypothetical protein